MILVLSDHQRALLKEIHKDSTEIQVFLDYIGGSNDTAKHRHEEFETKDEAIKITGPNHTALDSNDMESLISVDRHRMLRPPSTISIGSAGHDGSTMRQRSPYKGRQDIRERNSAMDFERLIDQNVPDPDTDDLIRRPSLSLLPTLNRTSSKNSAYSARSDNSASNPSTSLPPYGGPARYGLDDMSQNYESENGPGDARISRALTLPAHPEFIGSTFRSIPDWLPLRTHQLANGLLVTTILITIMNISFLIYAEVTDGSTECAYILE